MGLGLGDGIGRNGTEQNPIARPPGMGIVPSYGAIAETAPSYCIAAPNRHRRRSPVPIQMLARQYVFTTPPKIANDAKKTPKCTDLHTRFHNFGREHPPPHPARVFGPLSFPLPNI